MVSTLELKLRKIVELLKRYNPEKIILFGSSLRKDRDRYSDIDILIIKETKNSFLKRLKETALLLNVDEDVDILVYTPGEIERFKAMDNCFIKDILREGIVIYEK